MKYEQLSIGEIYTTEPVLISKREIISFATEYDPQYFHINEKSAEKGPFGNIIASSFHTIGKVWAEWVKLDALGEDCLGGLSANDIKWKRPVFPGNYLTARIEIINKNIMKPRIGILTLQFHVQNQDDNTVLTFSADILVKAEEKAKQPSIN